MYALRATAKLLKRMKAPPQEPPGPPTTRLGDWYANVLFSQGPSVVLCVSSVTLLPVILPARNLARDLPRRLAEGLAEMLRALGIPEELIADELNRMEEVCVAKTADRRVLGSMNDFDRMMDNEDFRPERHLSVAMSLACAPCGPIGMDFPDRRTRAVFGVPEPERRPRLWVVPTPREE